VDCSLAARFVTRQINRVCVEAKRRERSTHCDLLANWDARGLLRARTEGSVAANPALLCDFQPVAAIAPARRLADDVTPRSLEMARLVAARGPHRQGPLTAK